MVDYKAVFSALREVPQKSLPLLREEVVPKFAKQDQEFIKRFL